MLQQGLAAGRSMLSVGLIVFGLGLSGQSATSPASGAARIVGGTPSPGYPFLVRVNVTSDVAGMHAAPYCGGTLVAPDIVLTAAHCTRVSNTQGDLVAPDVSWVFSGRDLSAIDAQLANGADPAGLGAVRVRSARVFPTYSAETRRGDVALLLLERGFPDASVVQMPQASDRHLWAEGRLQTVVGYGVTRGPRPGPGGGPGPPSSVALETQSAVMPDAECETSLGDRFDVATMACLRAEGTGACYGDSGGPMLARAPTGALIQTGVVSWGYECGVGPSVYSRIGDDPLRDWILVELAAHEAMQPQGTPAPTPSPLPSPPLVSGPLSEVPSQLPPSGGVEPDLPAPLQGDPSPSPAPNGGPPRTEPIRPEPKPRTMLAVSFSRHRTEALIRIQCASREACRAPQKVTIDLLGSRRYLNLNRSNGRALALTARVNLTGRQRRHLALGEPIVLSVRARALGSPGATARLVQAAP